MTKNNEAFYVKCIKCSTNCANASAPIGSTIEENGIFKVTLGQVG